jgi:hypothetical protein
MKIDMQISCIVVPRVQTTIRGEKIGQKGPGRDKRKGPHVLIRFQKKKRKHRKYNEKDDKKDCHNF